MVDTLAVVDTEDLFKGYLERCCTEADLVGWVMRRFDASDVAMSDTVRAIVEEAIGCLTRGELTEQVMLNVEGRRDDDGYRQWCLAAVEYEQEREVRDGAGC